MMINTLLCFAVIIATAASAASASAALTQTATLEPIPDGVLCPALNLPSNIIDGCKIDAIPPSTVLAALNACPLFTAQPAAVQTTQTNVVMAWVIQIGKTWEDPKNCLMTVPTVVVNDTKKDSITFDQIATFLV